MNATNVFGSIERFPTRLNEINDSIEKYYFLIRAVNLLLFLRMRSIKNGQAANKKKKTLLNH